MVYRLRKVDQDFFKRWTREMAYVLGYFAADGTMIRHKNGGHFIEFHSTDKCLIEMTRFAMKSTHRIGVRFPGKNKINHKVSYRLQIGSKEIFADLLALGFIQNKSKILRLPRIPIEYLADFIRGYFDGDGCIYFKRLKFADRKKRRWIVLSLFTSGSHGFLFALHRALKDYGVNGGSLKNKERGFELVFSSKDSLALYKFMYNTASDTGLYLPRKYKLFRKAMRKLYPNAAVA